MSRRARRCLDAGARRSWPNDEGRHRVAAPGGECGKIGSAGKMCRSIKTLRPPYTEDVTDTDVRAAALQYVRKISGFRAPAARNAAAFEAAVDEIAAATARLLDSLEVRSAAVAPPRDDVSVRS
jgi:hypothetical protein